MTPAGVTFYKVSDFQEVKYYGKIYCLSVSTNGNYNINSLNVFLFGGMLLRAFNSIVNYRENTEPDFQPPAGGCLCNFRPFGYGFTLGDWQSNQADVDLYVWTRYSVT